MLDVTPWRVQIYSKAGGWFQTKRFWTISSRRNRRTKSGFGILVEDRGIPPKNHLNIQGWMLGMSNSFGPKIKVGVPPKMI